MDCILATSSLNNNGYAYICKNGKWTARHRDAWIQAHGDIPNGMIIRHKCRNRNCYNVNHLEIGTHAQNNGEDRIRDGTDETNEKSPSCKLTQQQIQTIRSITGRSQKDIAKEYGVSQSLISMILAGRRRRHAMGSPSSVVE